MLARFALLAVLVFSLVTTGCSSQSGLANSATHSMGDWSPVGSQEITRTRQFTLASHYHLATAGLVVAGESETESQLHTAFSQQLARELRRYFLQVNVHDNVPSVQDALTSAGQDQADILLVLHVQRWPDIDPVRVQECENADGQKALSLKPCDSTKEDTQGEMALMVAIYDVRAGIQIDTLFARSQRGIASFVYDDTKAELQHLCKLIAGQLSVHDKRS